MTELLPKPKRESFRYPASYPRQHYGDCDERGYDQAMITYYKRLAEFAVIEMQAILDSSYSLSPQAQRLREALSRIKQSEGEV